MPLSADLLIHLLSAPHFDRSAWMAVSSAHLHLRFGNEAVLVEQVESLDRLERWLSGVQTFGATFLEHWQRREAIFIEADVQPLDHHAVTPCAIVVRMSRGKLLDARVYIDRCTEG